MRNKKIISIALCITAVFMAVGYAIFATNLRINGSVGITGKWLVHFTSITTGEKTTGASNNTDPTASGTTATMDANLELPGDSITYTLTLANDGNVNAIIENVNAKAEGSNAIVFSIDGIKKGDKLAIGDSKTITIKIKYDENFTSQPEETSKILTVDIDCVQDVGQTITSEDVIIEDTTLVSKILRNNKAQPDTNIDFSQISSDTNGKGLYYTSTNTEDNKRTYYFRGAVDNNYVSFANNIWRIVRINEDGTIRIIKEDSINRSRFNENKDDAAYVGYMYGTPSSTTYAATHRNTNSSTIKTMLDTWYQNNLINYSSIISDSGFCGDRSIAPSAKTWVSTDTALGYGPNETYYGDCYRLALNKTPQFKCPQTNDLYTTTTSTKGNKALNYPIGLITADEEAYAGGVFQTTNEDYYLANGEFFWTMSPLGSNYSAFARVWVVAFYGDLVNTNVASLGDGGAVRPAINLKSTAEIIDGGNGTLNNPYVIKTN